MCQSSKAFIALKDAFPHTIPIMLGYIFMGAVFGILLQKNRLWCDMGSYNGSGYLWGNDTIYCCRAHSKWSWLMGELCACFYD